MTADEAADTVLLDLANARDAEAYRAVIIRALAEAESRGARGQEGS